MNFLDPSTASRCRVIGSSAKEVMTTPSLTDSVQRYIRGSIRITPLATIGVILTVVLANASSAQTSGSFCSSISSSHVDLGETFTFFFLMLGPIKILGPFVKMTESAEGRFRRQLAIRAIIFSCLALAAAAVVGERTLRDYGVSLNVLALTGGLVLSVVAFQKILEQFRPVAIEETATETLSLDYAAFVSPSRPSSPLTELLPLSFSLLSPPIHRPSLPFSC